MADEEKNGDSLILFSGVDLLFRNLDEGFWRSLKHFTEITKVRFFKKKIIIFFIRLQIPIIFTANTLEANTGLNPEQGEEVKLNEKCTEVHLSRICRDDVLSMLQLVALNQGDNWKNISPYIHIYSVHIIKM